MLSEESVRGLRYSKSETETHERQERNRARRLRAQKHRHYLILADSLGS